MSRCDCRDARGGHPPTFRIAGSRAMARRSTSKITAVDQPNNSTPFIAVMGPQLPALHRHDVAVAEGRVVHEGEIHEVGPGRRRVEEAIGDRPDGHLEGMRGHQHGHGGDHHAGQKQPRPQGVLGAARLGRLHDPRHRQRVNRNIDGADRAAHQKLAQHCYSVARTAAPGRLRRNSPAIRGRALCKVRP